MFCEKLFTFHSFPCSGILHRLRRTEEKNQKHEPQSAIGSSDIENYFFFPPR